MSTQMKRWSYPLQPLTTSFLIHALLSSTSVIIPSTLSRGTPSFEEIPLAMIPLEALCSRIGTHEWVYRSNQMQVTTDREKEMRQIEDESTRIRRGRKCRTMRVGERWIGRESGYGGRSVSTPRSSAREVVSPAKVEVLEEIRKGSVSCVVSRSNRTGARLTLTLLLGCSSV